MLSTDRLDLKLDPSTDDLIIPPVFITGPEGVGQIVRIRMRRWRGEYFRDRLAGLPMIANDVVSETAALLGQPYNELKWRAAMREAILGAPTAERIITLNLTPNSVTREVAVQFEALLVFEDLTTSVSGMEILNGGS